MGSSGDSYFTETNIERLRDDLRRRFEQDLAETEVNDLLQRELITINSRDVDAVNRYLDRIAEVLEGEIDGLDRILFGGSVAKHTYVDGLSDVDSLVLLEDDSSEGKNPTEVLKEFEDTLRRKLPQGEVVTTRTGNMAVTIEFRDGTEIQLLPALKSGNRISVSSADGTSWSPINPQAFADQLTETNRSQGGAVIPAIKLAKSILENKLGEQRPSGYHVEALAVEAFRDYTGPRTPKAMVTHLIESASQGVRQPIPDPTGQSRHLDGALGEADSADRRALSRRLSAIAKTMSTSTSLEEWRALLG